MCGISGILNLKSNSSIDLNSLKPMNDTLNHRGPDDEGYYFEKNIGLAHKRLSIIDLSNRSKQPMEDITQKYVIVFNGEIYNYLEIRSKLQKKGYLFKSNSDTEVILNAYREYDEKCLNELNGMFSFVIWDKNKKKLFCARDRFGIKPFYWMLHEDKFIFASEIKALLKYPNYPKKVDYKGLNEYLTLQFCLQDKTLFKNINQLMPGTSLSIYNKKLIFNTYWTFERELNLKKRSSDFEKELFYFIKDSIKLQLRSDVNLGSHLSGGLDSSIISLIASQEIKQKLMTFSGAFNEGKEFDETFYAKLVSKKGETIHNTIYPNEFDFVDSIKKIIWHLDYPTAGPGVFPQFYLSKLASQNVKVVLGGQGGDELFGGYTRYLIGYLEEVIKGSIFETLEDKKHIVTLNSIIPNLNQIKSYVPMLKSFWSDGLFDDQNKRYFKLISKNHTKNNTLSDDLKFEINKDNIFERFDNIFNGSSYSSYINKMTIFDVKTLLPSLLHVEDRVSMANSLESRVPLLDHRIFDLAFTMPPSLKFSGGRTKFMLKKTFKDLLPDKVLNRKHKMGFPVPLNKWYKKGPVRNFVFDMINSKNFRERGLFDSKKIKNQLDTEQNFSREIWGVICIEIWFNEFFK